MTDRYGVIGHPIAHSKSPVIHRQFADQTRQDLTYEAFDIAPDELTRELNTLIESGVKGLNVTVPHKNAIADLVDELIGTRTPGRRREYDQHRQQRRHEGR